MSQGAAGVHEEEEEIPHVIDKRHNPVASLIKEGVLHASDTFFRYCSPFPFKGYR
jgi:hypothetical protein